MSEAAVVGSPGVDLDGSPDPAGPALPNAAIAALAVAGAVLLVVARRRRSEPVAAGPTDASPGEPTAPGKPQIDLEALLAAALAAGQRGSDGRGGHASDRDDAAGSGPGDTAGHAPADGQGDAPVWVRRLDERIPVLPTIGTLPVDHDGPSRRAPKPGRRHGG